MKKISKKFSLVQLLLLFVSSASAIVLFVMMFLKALTTGGNDPTVYTGMDIAFGKFLGSTSSDWEWLGRGEYSIEANAMLIVTYLLPLVICLIGALLLILLKKKSVKLIAVLFLASFIVSIVGIFYMQNLATTKVVTTSAISNSTYTGHFASYALTSESIVAGCFSCIGAFTSALLLGTK